MNTCSTVAFQNKQSLILYHAFTLYMVIIFALGFFQDWGGDEETSGEDALNVRGRERNEEGSGSHGGKAGGLQEIREAGISGGVNAWRGNMKSLLIILVFENNTSKCFKFVCDRVLPQ